MTMMKDTRVMPTLEHQQNSPLRVAAFGMDLVVRKKLRAPLNLSMWHWIVENFPPVAGLDILEVDCGCGLLGLSLAKAGAQSCTLIDPSASAISNVIENAERNAIKNIDAYQSLLFSNIPSDRRFDLIIGTIPEPPAAANESAEMDAGYQSAHTSLAHFLTKGSKRLTENGRIIIGLEMPPRAEIDSRSLSDNQLRSRILVQGVKETKTECYRLVQFEKQVRGPLLRYSQSQALTEQARSVYPDGVTRVSVGTVSIRASNREISIYAHSGQGARICDADGNSYLDFHNNFSTLIHGHRHAETVSAVTAQLERGICFGNPTTADVELANLICARIPAIQRVRFLNSGTEAVMFAIKAARAMTGRTSLAKLEGAFHGTYDWAEVSTRSNPNNWGDDYPNSNPPYRNTPSHIAKDVVVLPQNDVEKSKRIIEERASDLACIIVDMLPCAAGMIPLRADYLSMLQDTAKQHGIILISDEVVCFRLGYHGASAARAFRPDLITLGKVVGGGLPIGVVGGRASIMEAFAPQNAAPVPQGGTFSANPLTMVAGCAALTALTPTEVERINGLGSYLRQRAEIIASEHGVPISVQGDGSLFRFHAKKMRPTNYREAYHGPIESEILFRLHATMLEHGVYVAAPFWGSISTAMGKSDVDVFLDAFDASLREIAKAKTVGKRSG